MPKTDLSARFDFDVALITWLNSTIRAQSVSSITISGVAGSYALWHHGGITGMLRHISAADHRAK
jgi:hypothetical protein